MKSVVASSAMFSRLKATHWLAVGPSRGGDVKKSVGSARVQLH
jgi:hypothetical protein